MLSGGGARAAYQVACLRHIAQVIPEYRPKFYRRFRRCHQCGVFTAYRGDWLEAVERLRTLWLSSETSKVYHADLRHVLRRVLHWGLRVLSGGRMGRGDVRGMVDSSPLQQFLRQIYCNRMVKLRVSMRTCKKRSLKRWRLLLPITPVADQSLVQSSNDELWQQGQLLSPARRN